MIRNSRGFTMIEVLAGAAILGVATLIGMSLTSINTQSMGYDNNRIVATVLASNIMEDLLEQYAGNPDLLDGANNPHTLYYDAYQNTTTKAKAFYTAIWNITLDAPTSGILTINMTVSWVGNLTDSVSLTSYRSDQ